MRILIVLALLLLPLGGGTACSSSDDPCHRMAAKLDSCGLGVAPDQKVVCESTDSVEACKIDCIMSAACADLVPSSKNGPFVACERGCYASVLGVDPFTCDDLSGFTPRAEVCDGKPQCTDGSDEKGCPDGGVTDGGNDADVDAG